MNFRPFEQPTRLIYSQFILLIKSCQHKSASYAAQWRAIFLKLKTSAFLLAWNAVLAGMVMQ
jgi:hypothetical protein